MCMPRAVSRYRWALLLALSGGALDQARIKDGFQVRVRSGVGLSTQSVHEVGSAHISLKSCDEPCNSWGFMLGSWQSYDSDDSLRYSWAVGNGRGAQARHRSLLPFPDLSWPSPDGPLGKCGRYMGSLENCLQTAWSNNTTLHGAVFPSSSTQGSGLSWRVSALPSECISPAGVFCRLSGHIGSQPGSRATRSPTRWR